MRENPVNSFLTHPVVVKMGGSLKSQVPELVPVFLASGRPILIVPGGGMFADTVRKMKVDEDSAHWMAIAAMDQYGLFITSQGIGASDRLKIPDRSVVFLPYCSMRHHDPLPHTWDVSSDTIAAWIADFLGLNLLILKPVDGIVQDGTLLEQIAVPIETEVVDPFFLPLVLKKKVETTIINGSHPERVEKFLRGEAVLGTRIGTTF